MNRRLAAILFLVLQAALCRGHEMQPAFLGLSETAPGDFTVLWKTPMRGEMRLAVAPEISGLEPATPIRTRLSPGAAVQTWTVRTRDLRGRMVRILGLEATTTEALVRCDFADGTAWTHRLTPQQPATTIPQRQGHLTALGVYVSLGIEHILLGVDHLLFVFGLLLLVRGPRMLLLTITSFTVAHSITLGIATFGVASVPAAPLNAAIALSILFLGPEIVRQWRGGTSLTIRKPWLVAFAFGLLHGFGLSSALAEAGLSRADLPLALLGFNLGVESGQILFVCLVLLLCRSFRQLEIRWHAWAERLPGYAIGSLGAFWTIQRVAILLTPGL